MRRLILHQLRHRPGRGLALGAGILVAAVSFSLLTAATGTEVAQGASTVQSNLGAAYDIVVFAATDSTPEQSGVVPASYLSGLYGGISLSQYRRIRSIPGVQVAAPIATVGYILATVNVPINVTALLQKGSSAVLELSDSRTADNGLTHYPAEPLGYVYVTPDALVAEAAPNPASIVDPFTTIEAMTETLPDGATRQVCPQQFASAHGSPFADYQADDAVCWSWSTGSGTGGTAGSQPSITADLQISLPLLVVAIDPAAEAELDRLDRAVVEGSYLSEIAPPGTLPVLASTSLDDGDVDTVTVSRLPSSAVGVVQGGGTPSGAAAALAAEPQTPVATDTITAGQEYADLLRLGTLGGSEGFGGPSGIDAYWETGTLGYTSRGTVLDPHPTISTAANLASWVEFGSLSDYEQGNPALSGNGQYESTQHVGWEAVPIDDSDTAYRSLERVPDTQFGGGPVGPVYPPRQTVGTFDPSKVQGFSALSAVPLEFSPQVVTGADAATRKALGNQPLEPDANIAGYLQEPPVLFTSLTGLSAFGDVLPYAESQKPISSIRVRVGGLTGTVPERLARVAQVANRIHQETELQVVTTAGSSPTTETIALPAGKYGRPALLLHENWVHLGVALVIVSALSGTSVALFVLILVVTVLFLINGSVAAIRGRRREIGVLRCTGWPRRAIFRLILGELLLLGLLAGVAGAGITLAVVLGLKLDMPLWRVGLIMPVAVVLAGLAGLWPAWLATRGEPLDAVRPAVAAPRRRARPVRGLVGLAWSNLRRRPGRAALAATALGVGVCALTVLLGIQLAFTHRVSGNLLGNFVVGEARGVDFLSAALAVGLGAASVADVLYLNLRERSAEVAVLQATGWRRRHLTRLALTEGTGIGLLGCVGGGVAGLGASWALGAAPVALLEAALLAVLAGTLLAALAIWLVVSGVSRRPITAAVAEEE